MNGDTDTSIKIRHAQITDAAEIARLSSELGYPGTVETLATRLRILLAQSNHFIAVAATQPSQLLGWVAAEQRLLLESGDRVELVGLIVDAGSRRHGIGKLLVIAVEQWASKLHVATISLRSNITRPESHLFYERLDYLRSKTQHAYTKQLPPL